MTEPTQPPETPTAPKTYNFAQAFLTVDGVPFPNAGGDDGAFRWPPARTPDDVRSTPQAGDAVYWPGGDVYWVVFGFSTDETRLHVVDVAPDGAQKTDLVPRTLWQLPAGDPVYVPCVHEAVLSDGGKKWELFPGPCPRTVGVAL